MNRNSFREIRPLLLVFVIINALIVTGKSFLSRYGMSQDLLIIGNLLVFLVCLGSFLISKRSFSTKTGNAFVRAMYTGFLLKFFVLAIAAFVYISMNDGVVNRPGLFMCMALYIVYTGIEVAILLKLLKSAKNG